MMLEINSRMNKNGGAALISLLIILLIFVMVLLGFAITDLTQDSSTDDADTVSVQPLTGLFGNIPRTSGGVSVAHFDIDDDDDDDDDDDGSSGGSDKTPPSPITGLGLVSKGANFIHWNWTNPPNSDFLENIVFLDGINVANTSNAFYNATGLIPSTTHTIIVHTKDTSGNVNSTDVINTQTTNSNGGNVSAQDMQAKPIRGSSSAPVRIIGYMGYNDPFSRSAWNTIDQIFATYGNSNISFEFRNYPLSFNDPGNLAAMSGESVLNMSDASTFYSFSDELMNFTGTLVQNDLVNFANNYSLNITSLLDSSTFLPEVLDDINNGNSDGVMGTPTFFVNGNLLVGAQPFSAFAAIIDGILAGNDTTPPGSITGLSSPSKGTTSIYWTWTNPGDLDFAENLIFIDGVNIANTSNAFYNATGLTPVTTYTITVRTKDTSGNVNTAGVSNAQTTNSVPDTTPPGSITGLSSPSKGTTSIYWTWTNPSDSDFLENIVIFSGPNFGSAFATSNIFYNATGLSADTTYTITVHTKDTSGNVNTTDVTNTQTTNAGPVDTTPPGPITGLSSPSQGSSSIYWTWTNPGDSDFSENIVFLDGVNIANTSNAFYNATGLTPVTTYTITVRTKDTSGNVNTAVVSNAAATTNGGGNGAPVLANLPAVIFAEDTNDSSIDLDNFVSDPDHLDSELTWTFSGASSIIVSIGSNNVVTFTAALNFAGTEFVTFRATDPLGAFDEDTMTVTLSPVDDAAIWGTLSSQSVDEDSADGTVVYSGLTGMCTDVDSTVIVTPASTHSNFVLSVSGSNLVISGLTQNYYGSETAFVSCNGVTSSFGFTVNQLLDECIQICVYGQCFSECD